MPLLDHFHQPLSTERHWESFHAAWSGSLADDLNRRLGAAILEDGRVFFGTTVYRDVVAFRPAIANWRTTEVDVDLIVPVARELGESLAASR